jgi:DNA-3-methyladenine glycosylase
MAPKLPAGRRLPLSFFDRDAQEVAADLLGKVLCHRPEARWLMAAIVETEAYYEAERASHASLGPSPSRRSLFMPSGTVYMYYSRGGDSFNVSCRGAGDAVLIKAGLPHESAPGYGAMLAEMRRRNPPPSGGLRPEHRLCSGQTLLCRALGLRVPEWDGRPVSCPDLFLVDTGYRPARIVRTERLGIPAGRDGHLPYRFIDHGRARAATRNPLARRSGPAPEIMEAPASSRTWRGKFPVLHDSG